MTHSSDPDADFSRGTIHLISESFDVVQRVDNENCIFSQISDDC